MSNLESSKTGEIGFISPTGPGSLGDQAMLDAATTYAVETLGRKVRVFPCTPLLRSGATLSEAKGFLATPRATLTGIAQSKTVVLIGADVLDGVYSAGSSLKRLNALKIAHMLGRKTRVLGSSWSKTPAPEVVAFLKKATWLEVLARDPISQGRMETAFERPVRLVADLGFLLRPEASNATAQKTVSWIQEQRDAGCFVLGVNLSGHTIKTLKDRSTAPFAHLISEWLDEDPDRRVALLPHDTRPGYTGDLVVLGHLQEALEKFKDRIHAPFGKDHQQLEAWDLKAIAGELDLVLTGRMHFAIASLGMGTPPVSITYQGKFEGLMRHFDLEKEGLTFDPAETLSDPIGVATQLRNATQHAVRLRTHIQHKFPSVRDLSKTNFQGM